MYHETYDLHAETHMLGLARAAHRHLENTATHATDLCLFLAVSLLWGMILYAALNALQ
jgi:hypothetical protein